MLISGTANPFKFKAFQGGFSGNLGMAAIISAVFWWLAFPPMDFSFLILLALVPVLWLADPDHRVHRMGLVFGAMLLAFGLGTWWVYHAALVGAVAGVFANAMYVTVAVSIYRFLGRHTGISSGQNPWLLWVFWLSPWLAMEYVHQRIDLDFPWMLLGHAFANHPSWIQFYEWTGVGGGTLWILSVNFWFYRAWNSSSNFFSSNWLIALLWFLLPLGYSQWRYATYTPSGNYIKAAAIQPNLDPYTVKFDPSTYQTQMHIMADLADSASNADLVLWPETALPGFYQTGYLAPENPWWDQLKRHHGQSPTQAWIVGASVIVWHKDKAHSSENARSINDGNPRWYTAYNSALGLGPTLRNEPVISPLIYHKSKLVIGVEKLPYPGLFSMISKIISVDLGGMSGQLGKQSSQVPMAMNMSELPNRGSHENDGAVRTKGVVTDTLARTMLKTATLICYESIFGEFCGEFVRNGANLICVMTNDGWWGNTDGHRQHLAWARLRAIEYRRDLLRSANTGISATINQRGDILDSLGWDRKGLVQSRLRLNGNMTFYAKHGDYLGRTACMVTILTLLIAGVRKRLTHRNEIQELGQS